MKKRLLPLLLSLALLLSLLPQAALPASAGDGTAYSGACGSDLTWTFDPDTGLLTIEGEGDMWDFWGYKGDSVSGNHAPWSEVYEQITALSLPEGLTSIGDCAFANCAGLTALTLPATVTRIGWWGFGGCARLTAVTLPESVSSVEGYAFGWSGLRELTFLNNLCNISYECLTEPDVTIFGYTPSSAKTYAEQHGFSFVSLGTITPEGVCGNDLTWRFEPETGLLTIEGTGDMWDFWGCKGDGYYSASTAPWRDCFSDITAVSLPKGLTSIGVAAFTGCWRLPAVELPPDVTRIGDYAFGACSALTGITIPSGVTSIGNDAFSFCEALTEVTIPDGITRLSDGVFSACTSLREVTIPDSVTGIGWGAFSGCETLKDLTVPESTITVEENAFGWCTGLESVTFLNGVCCIADDCLEGVETVTIYGYTGSTAEVFAENHDFPFVSLGSFTPHGVCGDDLTWTFDGETGLLTIEGTGDMWDFSGSRGDGYYSSTTVPWRALLAQIQALSLPEGLTSIGIGAFSGCTALSGVTLPAGVTRIGDYAFGACHGLTELTLSEELEYIGREAFSFCDALTQVTIPENVRIIGEWAFSFCTGLTELTLPESVETVESGAFHSCTGLTKITFLNGLCDLAWDCLEEARNVTIYGYSGSTAERYAANHDLPFVSLGGFDANGFCGDSLTWAFSSETGLLTIEGDGSMYSWFDNYEVPWFYFGNLITAVSLPDGLCSIGYNAFSGCTALTAVEIPDTVTEIEDYAFVSCTALASAALPANATRIGDYAFAYCSELTEITIPKSVTSIGYGAFTGCTALTAFTVEEGNPSYRSDEAGVLFKLDGSTLVAYPGGREGDYTVPEGVTEIEPFAFRYAFGLTAITLPDSLKTVGCSAFETCEALETVCFGANLETIEDYAFENCPITALVFPDSLQLIGEDAFCGCAVRTLVFPQGHCYLGSFAFCGCGNLTELTLPMTLDGGFCAFQGCSGLTKITVGMPYLAYGAFYDCEALTEVTLLESVSEIGNDAFDACPAISSITILNPLCEIPSGTLSDSGRVTVCGYSPSTAEDFAEINNYPFVSLGAPIYAGVCGDDLTWTFDPASGLLTIEGSGAMWDFMVRTAPWAPCADSIRRISLPDGLTSISRHAFLGCTALEEVTIPASVTEIGLDAFGDCTIDRLICRNPDARLMAYMKNEYNPEDTPEDLTGPIEWIVDQDEECGVSLGVPEQTVVYGPHDAAAAEAEMQLVMETDDRSYRSTTGWRTFENYVNHFGYTFYATNVFSDVKEGKFYEIPVAWAYGKGVTSGVDETHFGPKQDCTRAQVVTFLWNAMGQPEPTITEHPFTDVKPGKFYYNAMLWAYETGVTSGLDETHFGPSQTCTRGQVVTFLWNAMGNPAPTVTEHPFVDVKPGKFYYNAMLWALENGITAGIDETHFAPSQTCTRGQVVTFLYNTMGP